jgi:dTDP-4-amino-4,6-dideoxygalactose transaminase
LINDSRYIERAEIIREKGTNRSRFFRGQVDKYTWVDVGSSYLPSDLLAAYLYAQFEKHEQIQSKRRSIWEYYAYHLSGWADANGIQIPTIPADCEQAYHMFYLVFPTLEQRQGFIQYMKMHQILTVFHYQPLHLSEMGQRYGGKPGDCPVTERVSDCLVRLPFYYDLSETDLASIVEAARAFKISP